MLIYALPFPRSGILHTTHSQGGFRIVTVRAKMCKTILLIDDNRLFSTKPKVIGQVAVFHAKGQGKAKKKYSNIKWPCRVICAKCGLPAAGSIFSWTVCGNTIGNFFQCHNICSAKVTRGFIAFKVSGKRKTTKIDLYLSEKGVSLCMRTKESSPWWIGKNKKFYLCWSLLGQRPRARRWEYRGHWTPSAPRWLRWLARQSH